MGHFVVERYLRPIDRASVAVDVERVRAAVGGLESVRLLQAVFLPDDELCLFVFEGDTLESVVELSRIAGLEVDRILEAEVAA